MTVCIGAICEGGKSAVAVADKMVTFGPPMSLQMEPSALKKIAQVNDQSVVILFSGSVPDGEELLSLMKNACKPFGKMSIANIAEAAKSSYIALKGKRVEETLLRPLLGADYQKFQSLVAQAPSSQILQQILGMIMQHNLMLEVLVVGMDDSGSHLSIVVHPGVLLPMETTGYAAVGTGAVHAMVRLSLGQHNKVASLVDTVYNVYEAKKAAEVAPGVGKLTDMAIIKDGRVCFMKPEMFKALEEAHKEKPILNASEQEKLKKVCDECTKSTGI